MKCPRCNHELEYGGFVKFYSHNIDIMICGACEARVELPDVVLGRGERRTRPRRAR
jgi:transcription elongation factor Elf1